MDKKDNKDSKDSDKKDKKDRKDKKDKKDKKDRKDKKDKKDKKEKAHEGDSEKVETEKTNKHVGKEKKANEEGAGAANETGKREREATPTAEDETTNKKLKEAEENMLINSSTHNAEYSAFRRWIKNGKRFPSILGTRLQTEEGRASLFRDWVLQKGCVEDIIAKHKHEMEEAQKSEVKYGFRSEKWLKDTHGEQKALKILNKKKSQGLYITDHGPRRRR